MKIQAYKEPGQYRPIAALGRLLSAVLKGESVNVETESVHTQHVTTGCSHAACHYRVFTRMSLQGVHTQHVTTGVHTQHVTTGVHTQHVTTGCSNAACHYGMFTRSTSLQGVPT